MAGTLYLEIRDKGIIVNRISQPINSWVMNVLRVHVNQHASLSSKSPLTGIGGASINTLTSYFGNTNIEQKGIVVGTGTNESTFLDQSLQSKIASGSGSGQLNYGTQSVLTQVSNGIVTSVVERTFSNGSGGDITINEVGIHGTTSSSPTVTTGEHLVLRDKLDVGLTVSDGQQVVVRFTFNFDAGINSFLNGNFWHFYSDSNGVQANSYNIIRTTGASTSGASNIVASGVGEFHGLVVGSSDVGENKNPSTQFALGSKIAHGTGAGQLSYGSTDIGVPTETVDGGIYRIQRSIVNNSGSDVTVREIGLYAFMGFSEYAMIARRVLSTPVVIPNGAGELFYIDISASH